MVTDENRVLSVASKKMAACPRVLYPQPMEPTANATTKDLLIEQRGHLGVLTLNRPEVRNALSPKFWGQIAAGVRQLDQDPEIRAIILTGADPAFCAGFDLRGLSDEDEGERQRRLASESPFVGMLPPHDTPIIAAVNGAAVTGGLELALSCDVLIASTKARFADTHAKVGAMPGGGLTMLLPARVGPGRARRMSLTGAFVDADTAAFWGLVDDVVPHEELLPRAIELAEAMAQLEPATVAELRSMYDAFNGRSGHEALAEEQAWAKKWMAERFNRARLTEDRDQIIEQGREHS